METIFFQTNGNIYFTYGVPTMWELLWVYVQWKSVRIRFQMDRILDAKETKHSSPPPIRPSLQSNAWRVRDWGVSIVHVLYWGGPSSHITFFIGPTKRSSHRAVWSHGWMVKPSEIPTAPASSILLHSRCPVRTYGYAKNRSIDDIRHLYAHFDVGLRVGIGSGA